MFTNSYYYCLEGIALGYKAGQCTTRVLSFVIIIIIFGRFFWFAIKMYYTELLQSADLVIISENIINVHNNIKI